MPSMASKKPAPRMISKRVGIADIGGEDIERFVAADRLHFEDGGLVCGGLG